VDQADNKDGRTPLHNIASQNGHVSACEGLLNHGAARIHTHTRLT
jgi:hypothetical protein